MPDDPNSTLARNQERISAALDVAGHGRPPRGEENLRVARAMAERLPLAHGLTVADFEALASNYPRVGWTLLPAAQLVAAGLMPPLPAHSAKLRLGTDHCVFFYCGAFRYPRTQSGFLFAPSLEKAPAGDGRATPFDSGSILGHAQRPDPDEPARVFLARHTLAVPEYRELLGKWIHQLFDRPIQYLEHDGAPPVPDPVGLQPLLATGAYPPACWTFEVRFPRSIPVVVDHLLAVFFPSERASHPKVRAMLAAVGPDRRQPLSGKAGQRGDFARLHGACLEFLRKNHIIPA